MKEKKYISQYGKEYKISFKIKKDIPDISSCLYRFQIYTGDNAFGCDFVISNQKTVSFNLSEKDIINICFGLIYKMLDLDNKEYCSVRIGEEKIIEYLQYGIKK